MSSGSLGLTVAQLETCISYPKRKRIQPPPPISTNDSRRLLEQYRADATGPNARPRISMCTTVPKKADAVVASSAFFLDRYEAAMATGALSDALAAIREALRLGDVSVDIFAKLALIHEEMGEWATALDNWTDAVTLDPLFHEAYERRADCYVALGDPHGALLEMEKFLQLEPATKALLVKTGKCALDGKKFEVAERYFHEALKLPAAENAAANDYASYHAGEEEATDAPGPADEDATHDAYALFNLGDLEEQRGDSFRAKAHYAAVLKRDPNFCTPYLENAEEEFANGNFADALAQFESVSKVLSRSE